ncbi:MAG: hypothetical protein K5908_07660 [Erysipelotrichaceae bacterium]|nr:hypothetical protein [Erysipelotrichaceae bacterium]
MIWEILKIKETNDKKQIRDAYREQLSYTNPEDKPEEFKRLREAYEAALAYADEHRDETFKTPIEQWCDELRDLYSDFQGRQDVKKWQKLLNEKICLSIDSRMECEERLLQFLMEDYFLPHDIWIYLDSQFSWQERQEELYESYPRDFIDYVILNGIRFDDTLPFGLFEPGRDGNLCRRYLDLFYKSGNQNDPDEAMSAAEEMMGLSEQHPYGTGRYLMMKIANGDPEAKGKLEALHQKYPEDMHIALLFVQSLYEGGEYDRCLEKIDELKKLDESSIRLRWYEALCLGDQKRFSEAVKILNVLLGDTAGDVQSQYEVDLKRREYNESIIEELSSKMEEGGDDKTAMELAWSYLENDYLDKAKEVSETISQDYEDRFSYFNLMSSIALSKEENGKAVSYLEKLIQAAEDLPEDDKENIKRRKRIPEFLMKLAYCLDAGGDLQKAEEVYDRALDLAENKSEVLLHLSRVSFNRHDYDKTIEYCKRIVKEYPGLYQGYLTMAMAWFYKRNDREAYNAVERSLDLYRSDLYAYALKARILIRNDAADEARNIIEFLEQNGLEDDATVLFVKGVLKEDAEKDAEEAERLYERSLEKLEGHEKNQEYGAELLYRLMDLKGAHLNANKKEDRDLLLDLADRGLKCNSEHYGLRDYKAWLLVRARDYDAAMAIYKELEKNPYHSPSVESQIGYIYYQELEKNADKALEYYKKSLENNGNISGHFYAGMCCMYMMRLDEAKEHFEALDKAEENSVDAPYRLSFVYAMENDLDMALRKIDEVIEIVKDREGDQSSYYTRKVNILRRMGRFDEAIDTMKQAMEKYGYKGERTIFQILAQSRRLDEAERYLKDWAAKDRKNSDLQDCCILLQMYRGDFKKARKERKRIPSALEKGRALEVDQILYECFEDYDKQLSAIIKWLEYRKENGAFDLSRIQGTLSLCYFRLGDMKKAKKYALAALEEIDEHLNSFDPDKLLFMARKIRILAILGKKEEMEELIRECQKTPHCQFCPERHCKDVDFFTMGACEILGDYQKAYEIACAAADRYPDEEDFIIAKHTLQKAV